MNDRLHNAVASIAPPIVASPAKRIQAFTGDPDFMSSLARGLAVVQAFQERKRHLTIAQISHRTEIPRAAVRRCPSGKASDCPTTITANAAPTS